MPFSLKNVGTTYQWLVNKIVKDQIGQNMKIYIDDMLIQNFKETNYIRELEESLNTLHWYQMKLNLSQCVFSITTSKFLEFLVLGRALRWI